MTAACHARGPCKSCGPGKLCTEHAPAPRPKKTAQAKKGAKPPVPTAGGGGGTRDAFAKAKVTKNTYGAAAAQATTVLSLIGSDAKWAWANNELLKSRLISANAAVQRLAHGSLLRPTGRLLGPHGDPGGRVFQGIDGN